jgi:hypothetical protein
MSRTIPPFGIVLEMKKAYWKPFRNALDKSDSKKIFDDIPKICFIVLASFLSKLCLMVQG